MLTFIARVLGLGMKTVPRDRAPYFYRLAKYLSRKHIRGSWRLLNLLQRVGMLDRPVLYPLSGPIQVAVPIGRTRYDEIDIAEYESDFIHMLACHVTQLPDPLTLIDGGADFGLFSLKLLSMCPSIRRILAFEPNQEGYLCLRFNLDRLPFPAEAIPKALADFEGHGDLEIPSADIAVLSDWPLDYAAKFLKESPHGSISVTMIDSLAISPSESLIVKLDIEGGELPALRGAAHVVQTAKNVVLAIEAHPLVTRRTGVDPVECLRLLSTWRTFRFIAAESGASLDIRRPVFDQLPQEIHNIIAISESSKPRRGTREPPSTAREVGEQPPGPSPSGKM